MGIISFSHSPVLSAVLAPLQALAAWFVPTQATPRQFAVPAGAQHAPHQLAQPSVAGCRSPRRRINAHIPAHITGHKTPPKKMSPHGRLKVVREFDSTVSPACAGRMVISGRMADVCAELERMAQREVAAR